MSEMFTNGPLDLWMYQQTEVLTTGFTNYNHKKENQIYEINQWKSQEVSPEIVSQYNSASDADGEYTDSKNKQNI